MQQQAIQQEFDFSIVSAKLTIEAMRDSGYKNTDHALAELIDNSVEAGAKLIEIAAVETPPDPGTRYARARVSEIAVADNGEGMDYTTLRRALKFGDGTRLDRAGRGIGRFGVGLPQSSISQCIRVDVWTWTNGADNAWHCYLDLDEIQTKGQQLVPEPQRASVPDKWWEVASAIGDPTGTLVVWSELDRAQWMGGRKTLQRTAELCGRIYRKFLTASREPISIALVLARWEDGRLKIMADESCLPNDPLYLMKPSATPEPFANEPMFVPFNERRWSIPTPYGAGAVHVRCTMARPDAINEKRSTIAWPAPYARTNTKAGSTPWGKHADRNKGVSIVRADRELEVSTAWVNNYEPQERWWSVEVSFDPVLDEIFGVVNNKQHAHAFVRGAGFNEDDARDPGESVGAFRERLRESGDPRAHLVEIWVWIDEQIQRMRVERAKIMRGTASSRSRHKDTGEEVEDAATKVMNKQQSEGEVGETDRADQTTVQDKLAQLVESAKRVRVDPVVAREWAEETVFNDRRVLMKGVSLGHKDAFFDVESVNDVIEVWLNDQHPVHRHLIETLDEDTSEQPADELRERLNAAAFTLKMILLAWARHEDKVPLGMKDTLRDVRMDWGREARKFLQVIE
ncbi:MAG: hypothetical protein F4164_04700 [Gemmatimonadales bacterium]|nr:hypothetical protein [Gemmatimonadales bacterium]MYG48669.1 hypothetical protein [Gemmatimonadales bacterium]MYK02518.1 hypothetical protein [Candidatus Palauibacter ramosifaciens]